MNGNILVLIASHINVPERLKTLRYALQSLEINSRKPDKVLISCSFREGIILNKNDILKSISFDCKIYIQPERKLQFDHYKFLSQFVSNEDIICFLDDDDLYHQEKIEIIYNYALSNPEMELIYHPFVIFTDTKNPYDCIKNIDDKNCSFINTTEYWCFSLKGKIFKDWFENTSNYIENMSFDEVLDRFVGLTDLVFVASVCDSMKSVKFSNIPLVYQRKSCYIPREYNKKF